MKILFAAAEVQPFIKTGGLGDVAFALPKALRGLGVDCRVILPKHLQIPSEFKDKMKTIMEFEVNIGIKKVNCSIEYLEYENIPFYFVNNEFYFNRNGVYGHSDDDERFILFSKAVAQLCELNKDFVPDIIHCNDWHSAIIPIIVKDNKDIKTVFTIHNLKYQGIFKSEVLSDILPKVEDDWISFMKLGIIYSDKVTTVSSTYSEEITHPELGEGLDEYLRNRGDSLTGITNGIDFDIYNPKIDEDIYFKYNNNSIDGKKTNKTALQRYLGLDVNEDIPLIAMVSRIVREKGFDLLTQVIDELMKMDIQLVILGTGDKFYEEIVEDYSSIYHDKFSSNVLFSNKLAKKIYAGSDMFLMPSFYEPCGLSQLIALRYGSVPIVRETGGLKDTVEKFDEEKDTGTGFSFHDYDSNQMIRMIKYAVSIFKQKEKWERLVKRGMLVDSSWANSAELYINLYESLLK